ncbi:MAG: hypothetical protein A3I73_00925 [Omnitrophica bacterium RIFCSPLOWO2_02_FULL_45_16]|nr:MAG: hypothetical protein A3C51_04355 [Omnitrophica bacterium RIFCSPHIGHO2_02_FULL_46_20]OGX00768.1 MAG: hypothetical protein A3I73_00925 [Omnitrophica bacterium RIFCSPLOWO2_02_FULL_45_16]
MKSLKLALTGLSVTVLSFILFHITSGITVTTEEAFNPNAPVWLLSKFFRTTFYLGFAVLLISIYPYMQKLLKKIRDFRK